MEICKLKLKSPVVLITLGMMVCLACSHVTRAQEIIPPERRTQWDPGIPGGIPEIAGPVENILDHGAKFRSALLAFLRRRRYPWPPEDAQGDNDV
ncbi:MAG: hypothetical protein R6U78_15725 [Bacteroidales bacterium]